MAINVLLVDDSAVMRAMVLKLLRMTGIPLGDVHQAGNGAEALELLDQQWVDVVMLDISMPVMRGDEMLEMMRAQPGLRELPVIVISSERADDRIARMQTLGATCLAKPFRPEQLRDTLLDVLGITL